jgi:hypothetical protein
VNEFLHYLEEYEKQLKGYNRLKRSQHLKSIDEILDNELEEAWQNLLYYMKKHSVDLDKYIARFTSGN